MHCIVYFFRLVLKQNIYFQMSNLFFERSLADFCPVVSGGLLFSTYLLYEQRGSLGRIEFITLGSTLLVAVLVSTIITTFRALTPMCLTAGARRLIKHRHV